MIRSARQRPPDRRSGHWTRWVLRSWALLAVNPWRAVALCALLGFGLPAAYGLARGLPEPQIADEFSYLLAADTFANGRLTNPTHPMWKHFEAAHILHNPTYASKYPPGQGVFMAGGQLLGHPVLGVWLSAGFAAAAVCWMLQAWTRPRWALLGTWIMIVSIGIVGSWVQTYWGGMVAAGGGALFFGGLRRLLNGSRWTNAVAMACGAIVLANSRPYEGLIVTVPAFFLFVGWLVKDRRYSIGHKLLHGLLPSALVLSLGAGWMLYYNFRITGDPFRLPYAVHQQQYFRVGVFALQEQQLGQKSGHPRLRRFYDRYQNPYNSRLYFFHAIRRLIETHVSFYYGTVLSISLLMWPWMLRRQWLALAALTWFFLIGAMSFATFFDLPHYAAPITGLAYLLCVEGLRRIRLLHGRSAVLGRLRLRYLLLLWAAVWTCSELPNLARTLLPAAHNGPAANDSQLTRSDVLRQLTAARGKHLVIVQYDDDYSVLDDWVYNAADIDRSPIVWAHDLGQEANQELLHYFDDRRVWWLRLGKATGYRLQTTAEG